MAAALKRARPTPDVDAYQRAWKRRQQAAGITAFPTKRDALEYADAHQHELVVALDKLVAPGAKVCEFATCCDVPDFLRRTASLSPLLRRQNVATVAKQAVAKGRRHTSSR